MPDAVRPAVLLQGLTKRFARFTAVDALSLSVPYGSRVGFLGPNGSGKTSAIKMMIGVLRPDGGRAIILGHDMAKSPEVVRRQVGYAPETPRIYRWMRVSEVIAFVRPLYSSWDQVRCRELIEGFELPDRQRVGTLSKGMLAKLSIALALSHQPRMLILDEPFSGLDPIARDDVIDKLLGLLDSRNTTLFFSSHRIDDVERLATDIGIINKGKLLVHGRTEDLLSNTRRLRLRFPDGVGPVKWPAGVIRAVVRENEAMLTVSASVDDVLSAIMSRVRVSVLASESMTLEEVFKDYVKGAST